MLFALKFLVVLIRMTGNFFFMFTEADLALFLLESAAYETVL